VLDHQATFSKILDLGVDDAFKQALEEFGRGFTGSELCAATLVFLKVDRDLAAIERRPVGRISIGEPPADKFKCMRWHSGRGRSGRSWSIHEAGRDKGQAMESFADGVDAEVAVDGVPHFVFIEEHQAGNFPEGHQSFRLKAPEPAQGRPGRFVWKNSLQTLLSPHQSGRSRRL